MVSDKLLISLIILISSFCVSLNLSAQKSSVVISGTITDIKGGQKIKDIRVLAYSLPAMSLIDSLKTGPEGEYKFKFETQKEIVLFFEKKGYIRKKILLNTTFPSPSGKIITNFFDYSFQMSDKISSNFGGEILDKPVIKVSYNYQQKLFDFDPDYAIKLKRDLAALTPDQVEKLSGKLEAQAKGLPEEKKPATTPVVTKPTTPVVTTPPKTTPPVADKPKITTPVKPDEKTQVQQTPKNNVPVAVTPEKPEVKAPESPITETPQKTVKTETAPKQPQKNYVDIPEIKAVASVNKNDVAKIELKRLEESNRKTVLEIVDRKDVIYEKFLQRKIQKDNEKRKRLNRKDKYETGNPLTSFYDANDLYELELKNKKIKKQ